jgi:hypothetical protein
MFVFVPCSEDQAYHGGGDICTVFKSTRVPAEPELEECTGDSLLTGLWDDEK